MKPITVAGWLIAIPLFVLLVPQTVQTGTLLNSFTHGDVSWRIDGIAPLQVGVDRPVVITPVTFPDLRYRLIEHFPRIFMCGPFGVPFYYGNPEADAIGAFPDIMKDTPTFQAIVKHLHLEKVTGFSDAQKYSFYVEYLRLQGVMTLKADGDNVNFSLRYSDDPHKPLIAPPNNGFSVSGYVEPRGEIKVLESFATYLQCPKCLALGTRIDTPTGKIAVEELKPGMTAWTVNAQGSQVAALVLEVRQMPAAATHMMVHVSFNDGREVWVSPGHPTADGHFVEQLQAGVTYEGATIHSATLESYSGGRTFDILLAGDTGFYWANGVLLASTLK